jgi:hypothetical protein
MSECLHADQLPDEYCIKLYTKYLNHTTLLHWQPLMTPQGLVHHLLSCPVPWLDSATTVNDGQENSRPRSSCAGV